MNTTTFSFSLTDILTMDGHPAPKVSSHEGHPIIEFFCDSPDKAVKTARAATRQLVQFKQDKQVQGSRDKSKIMLVFGMADGELPTTWRGRSASAGASGEKPAFLTEIQTALKGYGVKASYFNSSVNHGLTVDQVPCGLQFETKADDSTVAKLLLSKKGEWTEVEVDSTDQAVKLVSRLQALLTDL